MTELISQLDELTYEQHELVNEFEFLDKHFEGFHPEYAKSLFLVLKLQSQQVTEKINQIKNQIKNETDKIN
jgi:hypothetical protein